MTCALIKNATVGGCLPTAFAANVSLQADLSARIAIEIAAVASLNLRLSAALQLSVTPPALMLSASLSAVVALNAQLAADVTLPTFAINLGAIVVDIQAELSVHAAALLDLNAKLAASLLSFGTAGLRLYRYSGSLSQMGSDVSACTAGYPGDGGMAQVATVTGVLLVTDVPAADLALTAILGV